MLSSTLLLVPFLLSADPPDLRPDIKTLLNQGRGTAAGRAAWDNLAAAGPESLPLLLASMNTPDTVAANWLRTAFDQIVDRTLAKDGKDLPVERLLAFAKDAKQQGRARRLALELVEKVRAGTSSNLFAGWLEDPEFRYEAVAMQLDRAKTLRKEGDKEKALAAWQVALAAARDVPQAREAAAGLAELGVQVSVAQHLGFLTAWYLIGPFDAMGQKGFRAAYPPEKKVDLAAELEGQGKKVRWVRYVAEEAAPRSSAKHQVLVNLREGRALGDADDAVAFAYTEFTVAKAQEAEFRGAADDNLTVWVNGRREFGFEEYRNGVRFDRHRFKVQLQPGKNTVLVKICQTPAPNPEPNWEFFLRVVDATGKGMAMTNALPSP